MGSSQNERKLNWLVSGTGIPGSSYIKVIRTQGWGISATYKADKIIWSYLAKAMSSGTQISVNLLQANF